jgi:hypothetical protein
VACLGCKYVCCRPWATPLGDAGIVIKSPATSLPPAALSGAEQHPAAACAVGSATNAKQLLANCLPPNMPLAPGLPAASVPANRLAAAVAPAWQLHGARIDPGVAGGRPISVPPATGPAAATATVGIGGEAGMPGGSCGGHASGGDLANGVSLIGGQSAASGGNGVILSPPDAAAFQEDGTHGIHPRCTQPPPVPPTLCTFLIRSCRWHLRHSYIYIYIYTYIAY